MPVHTGSGSFEEEVQNLVPKYGKARSGNYTPLI